ncbi:MAG: class I SAM-dependent methyltransferase, partial [Acidimicrobiales bacterium]
LLEVGSVVTAMQQQGFEVRGVQSLREHYGRTLRHWIANLEANWEEANQLVGPARARIWRLYMAGCCLNFEKGALGVHQVLGVKPGPDGASGMPPTLRELFRVCERSAI